MDSLSLFFHSLLLRALAEEQGFCFSSSVTGTACLSSAAIILSVQYVNTQNLLGKQGISLLNFFYYWTKEIISKEKDDKSPESTNSKGALWCTGFGGPIPNHFLKRIFFFCLVWLGTSSSACIYALITVWTCRCSNMGEGNAFSVSSAHTNTSVFGCTGRSYEDCYADQSM